MTHQGPIHSPEQCRSLPAMLVGLICSSCGLGFSSEEELRHHQVICRSSFEFLAQFDANAGRREQLH